MPETEIPPARPEDIYFKFFGFSSRLHVILVSFLYLRIGTA